MHLIMGIDVGGSTTKIVAYENSDKRIGTLQVRANDQITSLYGALGHFLHIHRLSLEDISKIALTGVGASLIEENVYGIPTYRCDEFQAIGLGGLKLSGLKEALVISMGTGTAFVHAAGKSATHLGGSGVGGGTLLGLSQKLVRQRDISVIAALAEQGDLSKVDLLIRDISKGKIPTLSPDTTASNFGNLSPSASDADYTAGLINMVFQTVGMMGVFAVRNSEVRDVVLTGAMTALPQAAGTFRTLGEMSGVNFIIPENAVFATAIGAAMEYIEK